MKRSTDCMRHLLQITKQSKTARFEFYLFGKYVYSVNRYIDRSCLYIIDRSVYNIQAKRINVTTYLGHVVKPPASYILAKRL